MTKQVSIILEDWGVRERFHTLDWLSNQTVLRDQYELIWVELYSRVLDHVKAKVDHLLTLNQEGLYHKHKGMNAGIVKASGRIIVMCDSDAVYPPEFVASVIEHFATERKVVMYHQHRSSREYPEGVTDFTEIASHEFYAKWPNVGACLSVLRRDAIGFGGVDEHELFRGLICGHNELAWRMINAGVPEEWDDKILTYHFKHPGSDGGSKHERYMSEHHIDMHNLTGVDAFREGRVMPLLENPDIHKLRMVQRIIGTEFEKKYSVYPPGDPRGRVA